MSQEQEQIYQANFDEYTQLLQITQGKLVGKLC